MWDNGTLLLYLSMGIIPTLVINYKFKNKGKKVLVLSFVIWWLVWTFVASFREVSYKIGGIDALDYLNYFDVCLEENLSFRYTTHFDVLFRLFTKGIRLITSNRYVYFWILYGFVHLTYILFLNKFSTKKSLNQSYLLSFIPIMLGFCSIRTCLAIGVLLLAIILMYEKKYILTFILLIATVLIQKGMITVVPMPLFYLFTRNKKISWKYVMGLMSGVTLLSLFMREFFISNYTGMIEVSYINYARRAVNDGFFKDFWKLCFGQLVTAMIAFVFRKEIQDGEKTLNMEEFEKYSFIKSLLIYDFLLIPTSYLFHIYRGYQYLFLMRIIFLGYITPMIISKYNSRSKKAFNIFLFCVYVGFFILYFYRYYDVSYISPYRLVFFN